MLAPPPAPTEAVQLKPRLVRHIFPFIELADEAGANVDGLLAQVGLSRRDLRSARTELPNYQLFWLLEQLIAQSGDPEIGLRASERLVLIRSDFFGNLIRHCLQTSSELLTALQLLAHFGTYVAGNFRMTSRVGDETVTFTVMSAVAAPPEVYDCLAGAYCTTIETLGGPGLRPLEVRLPRSVPLRPERYEKFFGARVVFESPQFELVYALRALRKPVRDEVPAQPVASTALTARAGNTLVLQIRDHLLARLGEGIPLLPSVAKALGLSARTLRRRLSEVRSSYAELVDEARRERALALASRAELDVARLAELTGFADASAFARAFRRWTGEQPREYMRRVRERASLRTMSPTHRV